MTKFVRQLFTKGLNQDMNPVAVDLTMSDQEVIEIVSASSNFVFVRGLAVSRPVLKTLLANMGLNDTIIATANPPQLASISMGGGINTGPLMLTQDNLNNYKIRQVNAVNPSGALITYTGPAINGSWDNFFFKPAIVNSAILIPGYSAGILRLDPTAGTYTIMNSGAATAPYGFVTKLYAQAIAAFKTNTGAPNNFTDPYTVAWSVPGNEQDWTTTVNGAGSTVLSDCSDDITGLCVLMGIVVVCRRFGFTLGFPTGQFPSIFNFAMYSDNDIGAAYPATMDVFQNKLYFMSDVGVHTFDPKNGVQDIGEGVVKELNTFMQLSDTSTSQVMFRGCICRSYTNDYRPTYNLFVDAAGTIDQNVHWQYDIIEGKWARHSYNSHPFFLLPINNFTQHLSSQYTRASYPQLGFLNRTANPGSYYVCDGNLSAGTATLDDLSLTTAQICIEPPMRDAYLTRVMVLYNQGSISSAGVPQVFVNAQTYNGSNQSYQFQPATDSNTTTTNWRRLWFSGRAPGNLFSVQLIFPASGVAYHPVTVKEIVMEFSDQGVSRA